MSKLTELPLQEIAPTVFESGRSVLPERSKEFADAVITVCDADKKEEKWKVVGGFIEGQTYAEIGTALGASEGNAGRVATAAFDRLITDLQEEMKDRAVDANVPYETYWLEPQPQNLID